MFDVGCFGSIRINIIFSRGSIESLNLHLDITLYRNLQRIGDYGIKTV
jgi:hypothetical protein